MCNCETVCVRVSLLKLWETSRDSSSVLLISSLSPPGAVKSVPNGLLSSLLPGAVRHRGARCKSVRERHCVSVRPTHFSARAERPFLKAAPVMQRFCFLWCPLPPMVENRAGIQAGLMAEGPPGAQCLPNSQKALYRMDPLFCFMAA